MNVPISRPRRRFISSLFSRSRIGSLLVAGAGLVLASAVRADAQLQVAYGTKGVQILSYNGVTLENLAAYSADAFHIWHMQATDLSGNPISTGQFGWGENNNGESWNSQTDTETYTFSWGSIATQFVQSGNDLNMIVTETNNAGSGIIFDGAQIFPFALHFPQDPAGFSGYTQYAITTTDPGVSVADFGSGVVTEVIPNETIPMYGGWSNVGTATYSPLMTTTAPEGLATFYPQVNAPVQPGSSLSYTVSLRFTPEGTPANASDGYSSFAETYPSQMTWTDKRILGTAYLASSPTGGSSVTQPGGFPTNPRRYFNDSTVNITTPAGLQAFQDRILAQAALNVTDAQNMNAQGVITWDIEGEEYPQTTSYVCSPDQIAAVAPEMESTITDPKSSFLGQKLDDAYFKTMSNAGLRIGLCLRPQAFTLTSPANISNPASDGTASQVNLTGDAAIVANLENKARYANQRWGATVFYVDSVVDVNGGTLDPAIFQQLITALPNFLFIPEESTTRYYAYTAPFYSFIDHTSLGTASVVRNTYPKAFGANLVNDAPAALLAQYTPQLTQSVVDGDILMGHADYWQANDPTLVAIYAAAGVGAPKAPSLTAPVITWPAPAAVTYGTAISAAQLDATANVPGTFAYSVATGTVPSAGVLTLTAKFTPSNTSEYSSASSTVNLTVNPAAPVVSWSKPAAITSGTALSAAQLNASANVPGTFTYDPAAGTVLTPGTYNLSATFAPTSAVDYSSATATTQLTVTLPSAQTTPNVVWPTPAAITYGTALSSAQLDASANAAGTFTYSPAAGTVLGAGSTTLKVTFTPTNQTQYATVTKTTVLTVQKAVPAIDWSAPAAITAGTALSATQLNASATAAGTFAYTPATGTVLNTGTSTLSVLFTPANTADYTTTSASVSLAVNAATPSTSKLAILSPTAGAYVSGSITVVGQVNLPLDAAGSFLMVDGAEVGTRRVTGGPFLYVLDTTTLSNGPHTIQLWAHDISNTTTITPPQVINVVNGLVNEPM